MFTCWDLSSGTIDAGFTPFFDCIGVSWLKFTKVLSSPKLQLIVPACASSNLFLINV